MNESAPRRAASPNVVHASLDDEAILLNVETGVYFGLDTVGTRIWDLLETGTTEEEIVARLLEEYDISHDEVSADVRAFLQTLEDKGLVQKCCERPPA